MSNNVQSESLFVWSTSPSSVGMFIVGGNGIVYRIKA